MKLFRYIGSIEKHELEEKKVHACINEEGFRCVLIKNLEEKTILQKFETDNLEIKLNAVLVFQGQNYYFHILTAKKNDIEANARFETLYDYIFRKIHEPIMDNDVAALVFSLEEYFRMTPGKDSHILQIGVWGELFCIKTIYDAGYEEITQKYHQNFYSKHDIEVSNKLRIEIKTSKNQKRIHRFRHDQLVRSDVRILVASLVLEESQEGTSLWDLLHTVLERTEDPDARLGIEKTIKLCGISEDKQGLRFSEGKAYEDLRFFDASQLPRILEQIPSGVTKIEYDVDCALSDPLGFVQVIELIKNN